MSHFKTFLIYLLITSFTANAVCKIVLPHKLRYLENMLNSEVIAKVAKIRQQRLDGNSNGLQEIDKDWPLLLSKLNTDEKNKVGSFKTNKLYSRRLPNLN